MSSGSHPAGTLERLAQEVFERLSQDEDEAGIDDPQAYIERHVVDVQERWRAAGLESQTAEDATDEREICEYLRSAVETLPPRQRTALLLHTREQLSPAQIASRKRWTQQMVVQDLVTAYVRLATLLRDRFPGLAP